MLSTTGDLSLFAFCVAFDTTAGRCDITALCSVSSMRSCAVMMSGTAVFEQSSHGQFFCSVHILNFAYRWTRASMSKERSATSFVKKSTTRCATFSLSALTEDERGRLRFGSAMRGLLSQVVQSIHFSCGPEDLNHIARHQQNHVAWAGVGNRSRERR